MAVICNDSLTLIPDVVIAKPLKFTCRPVKILFRSIRKQGNKETNVPRKGLLGFPVACRGIAQRPNVLKPPISAHSFTYTRVLGEGAFGKVFLARMKYNTQSSLCAVKVVSKSNPRTKARFYKDLMTEQEILKKVAGNPHFIELEACWHSNVNFYFLTPAYPSCLRRRIYELGGLPPYDTCFYMAHLVHAMEFLHSQGIVHRDLKPDNVFIKDNGHLVLGDFGLAAILTSNEEIRPGLKALKSMVNLKTMEEQSFRQTRRGCGTPAYSAPEIYASRWYGFAVDVWALGVMHYEMLTARTPFSDELRMVDLARSVLEGEVLFPDEVWKEAENARAFVEKLMTRDPLLRPAMREIRKHAYLSEFDWLKIKHQTYEAPFKPRKLEQKMSIRKPWPGFENEHFEVENLMPSFAFVSPCVQRTIAICNPPTAYSSYKKLVVTGKKTCIPTPVHAPVLTCAPTTVPAALKCQLEAPFVVHLNATSDGVLFSHISHIFRELERKISSSPCTVGGTGVAGRFSGVVVPASAEEPMADEDSSTLPHLGHTDVPDVSSCVVAPSPNKLSFVAKGQKEKGLSSRFSGWFRNFIKITSPERNSQS